MTYALVKKDIIIFSISKTFFDLLWRDAHVSIGIDFPYHPLSSNFCFNATRYRRKSSISVRTKGSVSRIVGIKSVGDRRERSITRLYFRLCSTCNAETPRRCFIEVAAASNFRVNARNCLKLWSKIES